MEVLILLMIIIFSLVLALFGFLGNKAGWAIFPLFGGASGSVGLLALYADGNLTSGGVTLAAANGNFVSDFNALSVIPLVITLACFIVAARRIFKI